MKLTSLREAYTYDELLLVPQESSVIPDHAKVDTILCRGVQLPLPLLSSAMDTVSEDRLAIALAREGGLSVIHKNLPIEMQANMVKAVKEAEIGDAVTPALDGQGRLMVAAAVGANPEMEARADALVAAGVDVLCLDSAHGDSDNVIAHVAALRRRYPKIPLIAGNIVTVSAAKRLIAVGADCLKVGIGPGSICTTRVISGVGMPQASAVDDIATYCEGKNIGVIADGGIRFSGDIVKALALGATGVMIGSMFAEAEEAPGELIEYQGKRYKTYNGMGSLTCMKKGSADRYFQSSKGKLVPEGIEAMVPLKGSVRDIVFEMIGGLRSGMGYCGAANLQELKEKAQFVKISVSGIRESHPHDVIPTKEAPNYHE